MLDIKNLSNSQLQSEEILLICKNNLLNANVKYAVYYLKQINNSKLGKFIETFEHLQQQAGHLLEYHNFTLVYEELGFEWLQILFRKGLQSDKFKLKSKIIGIITKFSCSDFDFLEFYLNQIENQNYAVEGSGNFECPFGENLTIYLTKILVALPHRLNEFGYMLGRLSNRMTIVFSLRAITSSLLGKSQVYIDMKWIPLLMYGYEGKITRGAIAFYVLKIIEHANLLQDLDIFCFLKIVAELQPVSGQFIVHSDFRNRILEIVASNPKIEDQDIYKGIAVISVAVGFAINLETLIWQTSGDELKYHEWLILQHLLKLGHIQNIMVLESKCKRYLEINRTEITQLDFNILAIITDIFGQLKSRINLEESKFDSINAALNSHDCFEMFRAVSVLYSLSFDQNIILQEDSVKLLGLFHASLPRPNNFNLQYPKIQQEFNLLTFKVLANLINNSSKNNLLSLIVSSMQNVTFNMLGNLMDCLLKLSNFICIPLNDYIFIVDQCMLMLTENGHGTIWYDINLKILEFTLADIYLSQPEIYGAKIIDIWEQYLKWGKRRMNLVPILSAKFYEYWSKSFDDDLKAYKSMRFFREILFCMCVYGEVRQELVTHRHESVIALGMQQDIDYVERKGTAEWDFYLKDYVCRIQGICLLLKLGAKQSEFSQELMDISIVFLKSGECKGKFTGTEEHRKSIRAWIVIHLLLDLYPNERRAHLLKLFLQMMVIENFAETRTLIEWAVIRLILANTETLLPIFFSYFNNKTIISTGTIALLNVTSKLGQTLKSVDFFEAAFEKVLPWLTSNHFAIRLTAQYSLSNLWASANGMVEKNYIKQMVEFINTNPEIQKQFQQCRDYYFLNEDFDPIQDVNLEFLMRGCISVLDLEPDEKISSSAFVKMGIDESCRIPLGYKERFEIRRKCDKSKYPGRKAPKSEVLEVDNDISHEISQVKIAPWEQLMELDIDFSSDRIRPHIARHPIIIVASLLTKLPNLGGLCRTCETFNAELLVLNDLSITKNPKFLSTCVSAEKWMPMEQVKEKDIEEFLSIKKEAGYSIVGLEQSNQSKMLSEFKFPKKTVLLLGNEKEGVPARLLSKMDHIVEIPQYGVIRSLNVHVSGSIILWEYTKQNA